MVLGQLELQSAPAAAVAGDDDAALDADAHPLQRPVVVGHAVVHIDDRRGDLAVALEQQVAGQAGIGGSGGGVAGDRRLAQAGLEGMRPEQLQDLGDGRAVIDLEGLDVGLPAEGLELGQLPVGVGLVVGRADVVGRRGHAPQPLADLGRMDLGVQARAQLDLVRPLGRQRRAAGQHRRARQCRQPMPHRHRPLPNPGQQGTPTFRPQGLLSPGPGTACPTAR